MRIKIINVAVTAMPAKGKGRPYSQAEVVYKNDRDEAKTWKLVSFSNPQVFEVLKNAKTGDDYEITVAKDGEFTQWANATPAPAGAQVATSTTGFTGTQPTKVIGSTYETKEERALKQRLIVRQSSLAQAINIRGEGESLTETFDTAEQMAAWVYKEPGLAEMSDDIPY